MFELDMLALYINLALLLALWQFGFKKYLLDRFRQNLFEIRDEMFDKAYYGELSFESEAYRELRQRLNASIRYAHRLTIIELLVTFLRSDIDEKEILRTKNELENKINREKSEFARDYYFHVRKRMSNEAGLHLILSSPILLFGFGLIIIALLTLKALQMPYRSYRAVKAWLHRRNTPNVVYSHAGVIISHAEIIVDESYAIDKFERANHLAFAQ